MSDSFIQLVRMLPLHRGDVVQADGNGTAQTLADKYEEAIKYRDQARKYLDSVEEGIPSEVLSRWRAEEEEWLDKVVDIKNHKTLDNPFTAPKDSSEKSWRSSRSELTDERQPCRRTPPARGSSRKLLR